MEILHLIENIVNHIDAGLFLREVSTSKPIFYNPGFYKIFDTDENGWQEDESFFLNFVHPEDKPQIAKNHQKFLADHIRKDEEYRIITIKNKEKWIWVRTFPMYKDNELYCHAGIIEDITYRKVVEQNLTAITQSKDEILRILSHDLRSPLQSILGLTQLLEMEASNLDNENINQYIQLIRESCNFANNLMADLLDTHSLEEGNEELHLSPVKLAGLLAEVCHMFKQQANKKEIEIDLSTENAEDLQIALDATKVTQAFNNILSNAIKFTPQKGKISVTLEDQTNYAQIHIEDTGIGIPEDKIPVLFDKFTKARRAGTSGEKTTGLGMSITKQIIDQHQGEISVESKVNEGTTFTVRFYKD
ncbi:hypothetical protein BKI52_40115 [marine bacterium AO1-C]|nr:hypothetical protein BKI52_40115 [marine bacterium AO1-C]